MSPKPIAVVGAGWSGATVARCLSDAGYRVAVYEARHSPGGHVQSASMNGVLYEPEGAHVFHTSDRSVAEFAQRFGLCRRYEHRVLTKIFVDDSDADPILMSWPPQIEELRELRIWPRIERELNELPSRPAGSDLETYVVSMMGETLFRMFIRDYAKKQWGDEPRSLSSRIARGRIELRRDGNRRLFTDAWEFFPAEGYAPIISSLLQSSDITYGTEVRLSQAVELQRHVSALVITSALDDFLETDETLAWRGIEMRSAFFSTERPDQKITESYVVNHPSARWPFTRTVETKHATGQLIRGSVVSEEHPGATARHYPVYDSAGENLKRNDSLQREIRAALDIPVFFTGRLASYAYINQDEAIARGFACATEVASCLSLA